MELARQLIDAWRRGASFSDSNSPPYVTETGITDSNGRMYIIMRNMGGVNMGGVNGDSVWFGSEAANDACSEAVLSEMTGTPVEIRTDRATVYGITFELDSGRKIAFSLDRIRALCPDNDPCIEILKTVKVQGRFREIT